MRWMVVCLTAGTLIAVGAVDAPRARPGPAAGVAAADQDQDGVPDEWEDDGVDVTLPSGAKQHLNLKSSGASSRHKDIFVWIGWMASDEHSHRPSADTMRIVQDAFALAPIKNLDGQEGVRLHVLFSPQSTAHNSTIGSADTQGNYRWNDFQQVKATQFPKALEGIFRFGLFAHKLGGMGTTSGIARGIGGYDFIVSLGAFDPNGVGTTQDQAGTFMHELGHSLSLRHGGTDDWRQKPNYLSVMNYSFQFDGLTLDGVPGHFDYSRFRLDVDEDRLDRFGGMTNDETLTKYGSLLFCKCTGESARIESLTRSIDWDCSEREFVPDEIVHVDINGTCTEETLVGAEDWSRVKLIPDEPVMPNAPVTLDLREVDLGMARRIKIPNVTAVTVTAIGDAARVGWASMPLDRVLAYRVFRSTNGGDYVRVASTDRPSYMDLEALPGSMYSYTVAALVADRGAETPVFLDPSRFQEFRLFTAPTRGAKWAMTGIGPEPGPVSGGPAPWPVPRVLYQTPPSVSVTLDRRR